MTLDVGGYLRMATGQTIPPLLLEIVLKSGRSYYIKNVFDNFNDDGLFAIRIWDLRAVGTDDQAKLFAETNRLREREEWNNYRDFLPALDEANLWLRAQDVDHIVEWHDRFWPALVDSRATDSRVVGFHQSGLDPNAA
jgi:hypothetical protein